MSSLLHTDKRWGASLAVTKVGIARNEWYFWIAGRHPRDRDIANWQESKKGRGNEKVIPRIQLTDRAL